MAIEMIVTDKDVSINIGKKRMVSVGNVWDIYNTCKYIVFRSNNLPVNCYNGKPIIDNYILDKYEVIKNKTFILDKNTKIKDIIYR